MDSISRKITPRHVDFSATLVHFDGSAEVVLVGELDVSTKAGLEEVLAELISNGPDDVVLDLSDLSFIDSIGIGVLITTHKQLQDLGRCLIIRSPKAIVARALEATNLMDYLNIVD